MHFKKLELIGFKSFSEKTTLHFEPGVTAIVGPNGCGKSNIFDSIRWVLGEQSAKSLRGSEMQDVIFNGTDAKEPLGMAEVTLTFDNEKDFFPIDHPEVAITRRIFRSGESEYLLNKTTVRLKDIIDLLSGTGIGAESYSLVAQGKIDLVLSSRPEDRRLVFDEASGITKYKSQKREAMRRLEETELNLSRVNDIITEVKRQIGSLERQANKARRYKEVFEELKTKEIDLAVFHKKQLFKEKQELAGELDKLAQQEAALLGIIREQESKIANRQAELKSLEDNVLSIKNQILGLENQVIRDKERISFNKEKITELEASKKILEKQIELARNRFFVDEEKLKKVKQEYACLHKDIEDKTAALKQKELHLEEITLSIKASLDNITKTKKAILDLAIETSRVNNDIADFTAKQQTFLARKKRLELEKAKLNEEKAVTEGNLNSVTQELEAVSRDFGNLNTKISEIKGELGQENALLGKINLDIEEMSRKILTLESHKEFIEKLKTKYEDIGESMNAVILLDKMPSEALTGLVVKIKSLEEQTLKLSGEAKPIDLDTGKISEKISRIQAELDSLKNAKTAKEARIVELDDLILGLAQELRNIEINLANKKTLQQNIVEQFNKIKEEEDIIFMELSDVEKELCALDEKLGLLKARLSELVLEHKKAEDSISCEQNNISLCSESKEKVIVAITQIKSGLDVLNKRTTSDEATIKMLEEAYNQDRVSLENIERQFKDGQYKVAALFSEIGLLENKIKDTDRLISAQKCLFKETEEKYRAVLEGSSGVIKKIEADRKEMDSLKSRIYGLQMQNKDSDFKYRSIKERILQAYKADLESLETQALEIDEAFLDQEIQRLKEKLDSYGSVNLVAIEEYDELKKRYDFLIQQQSDLNTAKESLHQAILKINRTTKQMFLETFEKVRSEFRNYFRLLFNGGDAQLYLLDEQDPLESGIEIICRPPGKKLQNVLLLSGGEKSLSAIALVFAIFKVKPSPFCILDEIDAALDEANVDRYGRLLQEFTQTSQFIVITHNKKTISSADVMYGITMQESGVSKIVSVKFAQDKKDKEPEVAPAVTA